MNNATLVIRGMRFPLLEFCISEFEDPQLVTMDSVYQTTVLVVRGANMQQMV